MGLVLSGMSTIDKYICLSMHPPFFPPLRPRLAALGRRVHRLRQHSLVPLAQARSKRKQNPRIVELREVIARDQVPHRPGRLEPRAVKRRPKPYDRLNRPRHLMKEIPHRNHYRKSS
jgi:hypothetical protein